MKNKSIGLRVSQAEYNLIICGAEKEKRSISDFIRLKLIDVLEKDFENTTELIEYKKRTALTKLTNIKKY